ncbi:hypothetical protein ZIOFF_026826 [Zingiber officinale]|uniref:Uncharacterized protein n=1 Tax=Zingiber officinale TaxID=94328 RepID=A0A8J5H044_ZINOF|nr:hypothetical protein ZIOFF_026826 [Zingiber officinale]
MEKDKQGLEPKAIRHKQQAKQVQFLWLHTQLQLLCLYVHRAETSFCILLEQHQYAALFAVPPPGKNTK